MAARRPDSNLIPPLLALGAKLKLARAGEVDLETWFAEPANPEGDVITHVIIPDPEKIVKTAKVARSANAYPVLQAAVTLDPAPAIVTGGALGAVTRLAEIEKALMENPELPKEEIEKLVAREYPGLSDIHGSAEYKRYIAGVTIADLVDRCRRKEA